MNRLMTAGFSGSLILRQSEVARCHSEGSGEIESDLESCENEANVMGSFKIRCAKSGPTEICSMHKHYSSLNNFVLWSATVVVYFLKFCCLVGHTIN